MNKKKLYNIGGNLMPTSDFMAQQMSFVNQQQMPQEQEKTVGDRLSNAAKYGALGAKLGTLVPGVGNVVGGLAGAGIGMLMSEGGQINGLANNEPGQLTEFQGGGTHEQNPNGGINIGNNNLVEEGETMTDFDVTKFVFSDRIKVPGKNKSFADMSKAIKNKVSKDRPHDKATKRTTERLLAQLADKQEALKAKKEKSLQSKLNDLQGIGMPNESQMSYGGQIGLPKIKILGNGGPRETWESKTGLPWSEAKKRGFTTGSYDDNVALLNLLNAQDFDKNKFLNSSNTTNNTTNSNLSKHLQFSMDPTNQAMGAETIAMVENDYRQKEYSKSLMNNLQPELDKHDKLLKSKGFTYPSKPISINDESSMVSVKPGKFLDPETNEPLTLKNGKYYRKDELDSLTEVDNAKKGNTDTEEDYNLRPAYDPYLAAAGTLANAIPSMYNIYRGLKPAEKINLERNKFSKIDLGRQRQLIKQQASDVQKMNNENIRRTAPSTGAALSASVATASALNQSSSKAIAESKLSEETTNVGISNQENASNVAIANQEQNLRWQTEANRQKALEAGLTGVGLAVASGVKDFRMGEVNNRYNERVLKLLSTSNRRYNPKTGKTEFISYED